MFMLCQRRRNTERHRVVHPTAKTASNMRRFFVELFIFTSTITLLSLVKILYIGNFTKRYKYTIIPSSTNPKTPIIKRSTKAQRGTDMPRNISVANTIIYTKPEKAKILKNPVLKEYILWTREESNLRPLLCKSTALPTELRAHLLPTKTNCSTIPYYRSFFNANAMRCPTSSWRSLPTARSALGINDSVVSPGSVLTSST